MRIATRRIGVGLTVGLLLPACGASASSSPTAGRALATPAGVTPAASSSSSPSALPTFAYAAPAGFRRSDQGGNGVTAAEFTSPTGAIALTVATVPSQGPGGQTLDGVPLDMVARMIVGHQSGTTIVSSDPLVHRLVAGETAVQLGVTLRDSTGTLNYDRTAVFRRNGAGTVYLVAIGGPAAARASEEATLGALLDSWAWAATAG